MSKPRRFDWLFRPQMADEDLPLSAEARFAEALAELPAVERSALALSEIGGLDTNEIAQRLGTEPAVVRKLLLRARESVRASLSTQGRRGLAALLPFQNLWQVGSSGPVVRAAGVVAAAIVAPTVVIGGAAADPPRATLTSPDPPHVRAFAIVDRPVAKGSPVVEEVATAAAAVAPARERPAPAPTARSERRSVRPGAGLHRDRDAAASVASVPAGRRVPLETGEPVTAPAETERPAPPQRPRPATPSETVARTVPRQVGPVTPPPPLPLPPTPPIEVPVVPPPLPVVPSPPPLPLPVPVPPVPVPPAPLPPGPPPPPPVP